jgi:hypothetical protein
VNRLLPDFLDLYPNVQLELVGEDYLEQGQMETVLDSHSVEVPGLSLYYPSRSQSLPKLRAFIELATIRMRRDFQAGDYLATPTS